MKANVTVTKNRFSKSQQQQIKNIAMEEAIKANEQYSQDLIIMMFYALYKEFGFGKKRLIRLWNEISILYDDLRESYHLEDEPFTGNQDTAAWLANRELTDIGVDMKELIKKGKEANERKNAERKKSA